MSLPIPENLPNNAKPSTLLVSLAIGFWALIVSGIFAGLIYSVGVTNSKNKTAASTRQKAYRELVPVLELVDDINATNREEVLLQALELIDGKVLKIDAKHPLAIQTKDDIQTELAEMKSSTISDQQQRISSQVKNIAQARREIDQLLSQVSRLESANRKLASEKSGLGRQIKSLNSKIKKVGYDSSKKITSKEREIASLKKQIKTMAESQKRLLAVSKTPSKTKQK